jgi:hypothetical protein
VATNAAALSQLQLAWLLTRRGAPDPDGSATAWLCAGTHVPRATLQVDRAHGILQDPLRPPRCVGRRVRGKTPMRFGGRPTGVRQKTPKGRRPVEDSLAARVGNCWAARPWRGPVSRSTPIDNEKGQASASRRYATTRRRGATAQRGKVGGAAAAFARARAYGGVQKLGAYACDTSEAKMFQRSGLLPLSPVAHGDSAMAELGLAFTAAEGNKRPRPAASKGARADNSGISRGTLQAPPLPCARALIHPRGKIHGGAASGSTASVQGSTGPKARPCLSPSGLACGGAQAR